MDRLEFIKKEIDAILAKQPDEQLRKAGFIHLYGVSQNCTILAIKRGLDIELSSIIGLLHDIYTYGHNYVKEHGLLGATEAEEMLNASGMFSEKEIEIIKTAIINHSDKKKKHDKYSEMLKDADVLQNSIYNFSFEIKHAKRLKKVFKSFGIKMKLKKIKKSKNIIPVD